MIAGLAYFYVCFLQVLTGEIPFRRIRQSALAHHVLRGKRPGKPENASVIGLSDFLWDFTQRCWDGEIRLRPEASEVVTRLGEAVVGWDGVMPPCPQTDDPASDYSEGTASDLELSESDVLGTP